MACLVIGDAPVLSEVVETPQSQDRTPRRAIVFAPSPAAAPYRASGLVHWRKAAVRSGGLGTIRHSSWGASVCDSFPRGGDSLHGSFQAVLHNGFRGAVAHP